MHTIVENTYQWVENCIWDSIKKYEGYLLLKDWLNAMFYHISVLVMFYLVKNDVNQFCFGKDQIVSLDFYEIVEKWPHVFYQMCAKTP